MPTFLNIPDGVDFNTIEGFKQLLPTEEGLNEFQKLQRAWAIEQFTDSYNESYDWSATNPPSHHGSIWPYVFKGETVLKEENPEDGNYCCGVTVENFIRAMADFYGKELWESPSGPTVDDLIQTRHRFFVISRKYFKGAAFGVDFLVSQLEYRWENDETNESTSFAEGVGIYAVVNEDPYQAQFGDYIQIQPNEDPMSAGHSCMFVGLDKHYWKGDNHNPPGTYDCIRVFNSNKSNDYGMEGGVGFGWYTIGKKNSAGFKRIFHMGGVRLRTL